MHLYQLVGSFGLENLRLTERSQPVCGPGQVRIRVSAVSLNYRDLLVARGHYNPRQPLPLVPVSDGVGEVVEVGSGVTRVTVGERVAGCFVQDWIAGEMRGEYGRSTLGSPLDGMLAEEVVLPEHGVVRVPDYLSDVEAATLPCAALTAWSALIAEGALEPGQTVLVQGTGGVSIFALQLALMMGARVIITSSSDEKLERAKALGAQHTINYRANPDWGKSAAKLAGGEGVDLVVEVGGAGTLQQSLRAIKVGGRISIIGVLSGNKAELLMTSVLMRSVRLQGILVGSRERFEALNRAIEVSQLRPQIDRVLPFTEAPQAMEYLASGQHFGKVCLELGSSTE